MKRKLQKKKKSVKQIYVSYLYSKYISAFDKYFANMKFYAPANDFRCLKIANLNMGQQLFKIVPN